MICSRILLRQNLVDWGWLMIIIHHGNPEPVKWNDPKWVSLGRWGSCMWGLQHHEVQMGPGGFLGALPEGGSLPPGHRLGGQRCRGGSGLAVSHRGGQAFGSSFLGGIGFFKPWELQILDDFRWSWPFLNMCVWYWINEFINPACFGSAQMFFTTFHRNSQMTLDSSWRTRWDWKGLLENLTQVTSDVFVDAFLTGWTKVLLVVGKQHKTDSLTCWIIANHCFPDEHV